MIAGWWPAPIVILTPYSKAKICQTGKSTPVIVPCSKEMSAIPSRGGYLLQSSSMKLVMYTDNDEVICFVGNLDVLDNFEIAKQKPTNSILFITTTVFMGSFPKFEPR